MGPALHRRPLCWRPACLCRCSQGPAGAAMPPPQSFAPACRLIRCSWGPGRPCAGGRRPRRGAIPGQGPPSARRPAPWPHPRAPLHRTGRPCPCWPSRCAPAAHGAGRDTACRAGRLSRCSRWARSALPTLMRRPGGGRGGQQSRSRPPQAWPLPAPAGAWLLCGRGRASCKRWPRWASPEAPERLPKARRATHW